MSDFPTLPHKSSSTRVPTDGTLVDYGDDGTARVRVMYEATQWTFALGLDQLTSSEAADLVAHYAAHKYDSFTYTWPEDSTVYLCQYIEHPDPQVSAAYGRRDYAVKLAGVAA